MSTCLLCRKDGEGVSLRTGEFVCGKCLLDRESSVLETQNFIDQLSVEKPPMNFYDSITIFAIGGFIVLAFTVFKLFGLYIPTTEIPAPWIVILVGIVVVVLLRKKSNIYNKPFRNDIDKQIEKLKSKQDKIRNVLQSIYANFWELPPDWEWRRQQIIEKANGKCQKCGRQRFGSVVPFHVHHKIFKRNINGNHALENLILLCEICHSKIPDGAHKLVKMSRDKRLKIQRGTTKGRTGCSPFSTIIAESQTSDESRYENLKNYLSRTL